MNPTNRIPIPNMAPTDPPVENIRKAIRDAMALHRRLSWVPDSDEAKLKLVELKDALVKKYEALGGTWSAERRKI